MGEYEPDDSRTVTLTDNRAPGEPPRTGPREASTRRESDPSRQQQQRQSQGGQQQSQASQSQESSSQAEGLWGNDAPRTAPAGGPAPHESGPGNPDRQDMQAQPGGPLAGNQPQAIDSPAGSPAPVYDQYEVNQPQNMHRPGGEDLDRLRRQAGVQEDATGGFGYGADGEETMADAPGSEEADDRESGKVSGADRSKAEYDRR